jgi:hypothetical protein
MAAVAIFGTTCGVTCSGRAEDEACGDEECEDGTEA